VTATRAQFTFAKSSGDDWSSTSGHVRPLVVLSIPGVKPLTIGSAAMKGWDAGYRYSWRGRVQEARANYALREADWFTLVEKFGLTPHLES
jgi:hypothetical protein